MRDIIEGWWKYFLSLCGFEDYSTYIRASKRGLICKGCEHKEKFILGDKCYLCGCVIQAKIRCQDCMCPDARW